MKRKKKIFLILLTITLIITALIVIIKIYSEKNKEFNSYSIDDNSSIQEIIEYFGCTYYKISSSDEKNFKKDIYISFSEYPIDEMGLLKKQNYEEIFSTLSSKMKKSNYRIIDEQKELIVRIYFNENGSIKYTINNDVNYFQNELNKYNLKNKQEEKLSQLSVNSYELNQIINNNWNRKKSEKYLGTVDNQDDNYYYYNDEGYKIQVVNSKIYNIVFTTQYTKEVIEGIKVGTDNNEVYNKLGAPTYSGKDNLVAGYKTKDYYVFFETDEISVYPIDEYDEDKNNEFAQIVTDYINDNDYQKFLDKLTDIYSDYISYEQQENSVNITYPLKGLKVSFGSDKNENGINIYSNYIGKITNDIYVTSMSENDIPNVLKIKTNSNLVFEYEISRYYNSK